MCNCKTNLVSLANIIINKYFSFHFFVEYECSESLKESEVRNKSKMIDIVIHKTRRQCTDRQISVLTTWKCIISWKIPYLH